MGVIEINNLFRMVITKNFSIKYVHVRYFIWSGCPFIYVYLAYLLNRLNNSRIADISTYFEAAFKKLILQPPLCY